MSSPRLRKQFEILFEHFSGQDADTQLDDVTGILFCTRRNARIVLNKLEEEGWIEWHPAAGRGKLSKLIFKQNRNDVSETLARRYLEEGRIGHALNVLDKDANRLSSVIQSYLGVSQSDGKQVIRLPYYRPLSMLNPAKPMRRSEIHIARQVFSGLTKFDENDELQPDLAHHWQQVRDTQWRFYIRPGVRFHNGELLKLEHVVSSIESLKTKNLFRHLERVDTPSPWVIDVYFAQPDHRAPQLFAENAAKVLPPESMRGEDFDRYPIGTGPYSVTTNNDKRLILTAFDGYFGYRPLLDTVEVWVVDEVHSSLVFPSLADPIAGARSDIQDGIDLDPGCTYLLLNRVSGIAQHDAWARYLSRRLNSLDIFRMLKETTIKELGIVPAHGIKPGWYHQPLSSDESAENKAEHELDREIRIAYYSEHPTFPEISQAIDTLLKQDGIRAKFIRYGVESPSHEEVDIWIRPMGIASNREDALAGWLLDYSDIEKMARGDDFSDWSDLVTAWRSQAHVKFPAQEIGKQLVQGYQVIPLFHCWLGISKDHCGSLQNAKCNALGWFDFSKVWVKPDNLEVSE
ncbi:SgrR sugar-phosphate stress transcriptional activator of SgrS small RNA [Vibrio maritimus]|uniref:SgrR sugar-phosphate stress transcriptional activator of SgrS small RNA n=1 Tax=Vibrio maritimus TaxID=990268 RepID=A0A090RRU9_9VIBR|nr:SgrR sugar-phosphate stress transcriptional activator of SgrS small RNA [Vibrio maritimus]